MEAYIHLQDIGLYYQTQYQRVEVLKNINLQIAQGEYVAIMGKSGSGKTSLLNLIAGFVKPAKGEIWVDGQNICNSSEKEINFYRNKKIGYVAQSFNLIYQFTVLENIMTPMLIAGTATKAAQKKAEQFVAEIGLSDRMMHFPNELSGGEQQRVAIARALVNNPDIILADEPTGNLDLATGEMILDCIDDIHRSGKTIILVTHDEGIKRRATRLVTMQDLLTNSAF